VVCAGFPDMMNRFVPDRCGAFSLELDWAGHERGPETHKRTRQRWSVYSKPSKSTSAVFDTRFVANTQKTVLLTVNTGIGNISN